MSLRVQIRCDGPGCRKRRDVLYTTGNRQGLRALSLPDGWHGSRDDTGYAYCSRQCGAAWLKKRDDRR